MDKREDSDDDTLVEGFLFKSEGKRGRLEKSSKARIKRERMESKIEREYGDKFRGNYD